MMSRGTKATEEQIAARHKAAHDLASPVRAVAILSDLLTEALAEADPDLETVRELARQLGSATEAANDRLTAFATELDG